MTRTIKHPIRSCNTSCECGMCGLPVRLVAGDSSRKFVIKAGEVVLLGLHIHPARSTSRERAVLVGDMSGRVPLSKARQLSPEEAIRFVKNLGLPEMFFRAVLANFGWIRPPACVNCDEPGDGRSPCGHFLCEDCARIAYADPDGCNTCSDFSPRCALVANKLVEPSVAPNLRCAYCDWHGPASEVAGCIDHSVGYIDRLDECICPQCRRSQVIIEHFQIPPEPPPDVWLEAAYESRTELDDHGVCGE